MLPQSDFDQTLWSLEAHKQFIYNAGMVVQIGMTVIVCVGLVGGLSTLIARRIVDPDLGREGLSAVVIMPAIIAFLAVSSFVRRTIMAGDSIRQALQAAIWDGLKIGMIVGFLMIASWYYLGQLAMTRAVYGADEYHAHPESYCSPRAALYGLIFAVPVALGCALYTAVYRVGPQVMLNWFNRPPD
jgi:hypothetical protein